MTSLEFEFRSLRTGVAPETYRIVFLENTTVIEEYAFAPTGGRYNHTAVGDGYDRNTGRTCASEPFM